MDENFNFTFNDKYIDRYHYFSFSLIIIKINNGN